MNGAINIIRDAFLQIDNRGVRDEDTVMILQLLEGPQDETNLDDWLSGVYNV